MALKKIILMTVGILFCTVSAPSAMQDVSQPAAAAGKKKKDPALKQKIAELRQSNKAQLKTKIEAIRQEEKAKIVELRNK